MQEALRFHLPDAEPVDRADFVEQPWRARRGSNASSHGLPLTIRNLRKSFGDHAVLRGVDLHIPAGQFVAIVGRSGCGKSTLLRARQRAEQALTEVGLADKRAQWPAVLSGGQKQRVALARALVAGPRVLAFDEPLGALDALTRISMQRLLERVWHEQDFTAILVTHDVSEAVALADRILVIEDGRIAHDVNVDMPRPRRRGAADVAALEGSILGHLLRSADDPPSP